MKKLNSLITFILLCVSCIDAQPTSDKTKFFAPLAAIAGIITIATTTCSLFLRKKIGRCKSLHGQHVEDKSTLDQLHKALNRMNEVDRKFIEVHDIWNPKKIYLQEVKVGSVALDDVIINAEKLKSASKKAQDELNDDIQELEQHLKDDKNCLSNCDFRKQTLTKISASISQIKNNNDELLNLYPAQAIKNAERRRFIYNVLAATSGVASICGIAALIVVENRK